MLLDEYSFACWLASKLIFFSAKHRMVNFFRATTRLNQSFQAFIAKWLNEAELTEGYFEVLRCLKQLSLIETVDAVLEGESY